MRKTNTSLFASLTFLVSILAISLTFAGMGINEESLRMTLRETARISLLLFLIIFVTAPLHQLFKNDISRWLMRNRRAMGISFGVSHIIHLALIIWLVVSYSGGDLFSIAPLSGYVVGGIGYAFIFAMLATSNDLSVKRLGHKRWKLLHRSGMYFLFLTFVLTIVGLLEKEFVFYFPVLLVLFVAAGIRLLASMTQFKKVRTA